MECCGDWGMGNRKEGGAYPPSPLYQYSPVRFQRLEIYFKSIMGFKLMLAPTGTMLGLPLHGPRALRW